VKRQHHLARRKSPPTAVGESTGAAPVPLPVCLEDALREDLTRANEQRHDWIEQQGRPQREVIRGSYRRMADFVVSTTDPDATIMPDLWGGTPFGLPYSLRGGWGQVAYHPGRVGHPLGSNGKPTHARVRVFRARFRWKLWPRQITGDTTYGTLDNIVAVEDQHMRAYVPLPDFDKRTSVYGKQAFRYDPERDVYICPNNAILPLHTHAYNEREKRYQADAATCNACPLKPQCTTSDQGRLLKRSFDEEYLEQVRAYHTTEPYQKAMRKRSVWVEPL
jgi:Transposase DDE domain